MTLPKSAVPDVYVLWHPRCALGERAAREIYAWLRPGFGLGPRVFYRSLPAPNAPPGGLPLALVGEVRSGATPMGRNANLQIVVPLIDDNMIADPTWRYWLEALAPKSTAMGTGAVREIIPVAMDATAFGAPARVRELNFIRPKGARRLEDLDESGAAVFLRSLVKQLTEALCRLLLGTVEGGDVAASSALKLKVFLSHAKADGTEPARRVRDYIYSQTQLAAFFDENDIPFGSAFARVLSKEVASPVALIAVRSGKYASRPWCRREISLFRTPRPTVLGSGATLWKLSPVLIVDALDADAATPGVPEFGNAPAIRWSNEVLVQEEYIVTTLLRDALLSEFHARAAVGLPAGGGDVVLNWLPDPTTLLHVPAVRETGADVTIHYPGHLSALELDTMWGFFPHVHFRSFEEAWS